MGQMGQKGEERDGRSEGKRQGDMGKDLGPQPGEMNERSQALTVGQGHLPESNIVDIIPNGGRAFPECLLIIVQDCLESTGGVMDWMV